VRKCLSGFAVSVTRLQPAHFPSWSLGAGTSDSHTSLTFSLYLFHTSNLELIRTSLEKLLNVCEMGNSESKVGHTITHNLQFDSEHPEIQRILATASAAFERYEEAEHYSLNRKKKRHQERDFKKVQRESPSQAAQVDPYGEQRTHGHARRGNRRSGTNRPRLYPDLQALTEFEGDTG